MLGGRGANKQRSGVGDLMPPMHGQIHHVAWLEMDVVPDALLAEGSIDVITFVGMRVETTIGSEGARLTHSEVFGAS